MQNVYYIDSNFIKENSSQYILSIRYSTDGLSFCVHNHNHQLLVFFFQPYQLDSQDAVIAKVKKIMVEDELLNLKYKKVYILPCPPMCSIRIPWEICTGSACNLRKTISYYTGKSKRSKVTWSKYSHVVSSIF